MRDHPFATKRATRAVLKASDLCAAEPGRMAEQLVEDGWLDASNIGQPFAPSAAIDFPAVIAHRHALWPRVLERFEAADADPSLIDHLAHTSSFGATPEIKGTARWVIRALAAARGVKPASIHELYIALGRGETGGFTVPAMNIRMMTYYTARAAVRAV